MTKLRDRLSKKRSMRNVQPQEEEPLPQTPRENLQDPNLGRMTEEEYYELQQLAALEEQMRQQEQQQQLAQQQGIQQNPQRTVPRRQYYSEKLNPSRRDYNYEDEYYDDEEEEDEDQSPLSIVREVQKHPAPKGTHETIIGGVPVDLHILEDYLVKTSPFALKTVMRYHNARNMEEIKNYSSGGKVKFNSKMLIGILLAVGVAVLGIVMIFFMPQIMATFQGGMGVTP